MLETTHKQTSVVHNSDYMQCTHGKHVQHFYAINLPQTTSTRSLHFSNMWKKYCQKNENLLFWLSSKLSTKTKMQIADWITVHLTAWQHMRYKYIRYSPETDMWTDINEHCWTHWLTADRQMAVARVVSSLVYSTLSRNLLITYVNQLFPRPTLQSDAVDKHVIHKTTVQIFML